MLLKLRAYIFIVLISASMIIYCPFPIIASFFVSEKKSYELASYWGLFVIFLLKFIVGINFRVHGEENIPKKAAVILSKHQSALDIFIFLPIFIPQAWVMKREIFNIPFFGWVMRTTTPIAIDRSAGRTALKFMIDRGTEKLKRGFFIIMYPEGTRTLPGEKGTYKSGGVILAQRAGVDVVPIALNTGLFWQKDKGAMNNGTIDVVIGNPISTADKAAKDIMAEVEKSIETNTAAITLNHPYYLAMKASKKLENKQ